MISKLRKLITTGLGAAMVIAVPVAPAIGGDSWGFSIGQGGFGFGISDNDRHGRHGRYRGHSGYSGYGGRYYGSGGYYNNYYQPTPYYSQYNTYPSYTPYNPVVRREVRTGAAYAPDGTVHSETTVEDRRASSYSPGRNEAVTAPRTTTSRVYTPDGRWVSRERTSWIGADGRPHSTTVDRETTQDIWGNTHTETGVTLKRTQEAQGETSSKEQTPAEGKTRKQ